MLEELSKNNKKWLDNAYYICKDRDLANDLVQDMYLYFSDKNIKVNDFYVIKKIYGLFIDHIRKLRNDISLEYCYNLECITRAFEPDDLEIEYLNRYEELSFIEKELIEEHFISEKSFREINKQFPLINYGFAYRTVKEALNKLNNG